MTIYDLWNECKDKTYDEQSCIELYTIKIRKEMIDDIKDYVNYCYKIKKPYPKGIAAERRKGHIDGLKSAKTVLFFKLKNMKSYSKNGKLW